MGSPKHKLDDAYLRTLSKVGAEDRQLELDKVIRRALASERRAIVRKLAKAKLAKSTPVDPSTRQHFVYGFNTAIDAVVELIQARTKKARKAGG